nr:MAG TPA: hypothetical protein [Caudoviricetes sp.]
MIRGGKCGEKMKCNYKVRLGDETHSGFLDAATYADCYTMLCKKFDTDGFDSAELNFEKEGK